MAIIVSIAGPSDVDGVPGQIQVRADGKYAPDVFDDLSKRVVILYRELWSPTALETDPAADLPMPLDPEHDDTPG